MIIRYVDDDDFIQQFKDLGDVYIELMSHIITHRNLVERYRDNLLSDNSYLLKNIDACIKFEEKYVLQRAKEIRDRFYAAKATQPQSIFG